MNIIFLKLVNNTSVYVQIQSLTKKPRRIENVDFFPRPLRIPRNVCFYFWRTDRFNYAIRIENGFEFLVKSTWERLPNVFNFFVFSYLNVKC